MIPATEFGDPPIRIEQIGYTKFLFESLTSLRFWPYLDTGVFSHCQEHRVVLFDFVIHLSDESFGYQPCVLPGSISGWLVNIIVDCAFHRLLCGRCSGSSLDSFPRVLE